MHTILQIPLNPFFAAFLHWPFSPKPFYPYRTLHNHLQDVPPIKRYCQLTTILKCKPQMVPQSPTYSFPYILLFIANPNPRHMTYNSSPPTNHLTPSPSLFLRAIPVPYHRVFFPILFSTKSNSRSYPHTNPPWSTNPFRSKLNPTPTSPDCQLTSLPSLKPIAK